MKNILFITSYFYPYISGLSLYPFLIAKYFAKANHKVKILTFNHDNKLPYKEIINKVKILRIKPHLLFLKGYINFLYPVYAWKEISQSHIVILNLPSAEAIFGAIITKILNKKLYSIYHCDLSFKQNIVYRLVSLLLNAISFLCLALSNKIYTNSLSYSKTSSILRPFLHKVVPTPPPFEIAKPSHDFSKKLSRQNTTTHLKLGYVGRISQEKGLEILLKALQIVSSKKRVQLYIAGPEQNLTIGESKYYSKIMSIIKNRSLPVKHLKTLSRSQLFSFYKYIDMLILPSSNRTESFGIIQLEATSQGTPLIAADLPGVSEVINKYNNGLLFEPGNASSLSQKILEIANSPEKFKLKQNIHNQNKTYQAFSKLLNE
jgi:glycosyltransferase involved in cell wall biosynthesis